MDIAEELLLVAEQDLLAATILFDQGIFNVSIFQLQQAIEKLVKSYGIESCIIQEKDLRKKVSHLPHKVFAKYFKLKFEKEKELDRPILMADMIPPHQRKSKEARESYLEGLGKISKTTSHVSVSDMEKITEDEIINFIEGFKRMANFEYDEESRLGEIKDDLRMTHEHLINYFEYVLKQPSDNPASEISRTILRNLDAIAEENLEADKIRVKVGHDIGVVFYTWYNLSIITSPHEQTTRYPSSDGGRPMRVYDKNHILLKYFPSFEGMLQDTIEIYKNLLGSKELRKVHEQEFKILGTMNES